MSESFLNGKIELHCGDCLAVLPTLAENSVDSCVTDPPYALVSISKRFGKDGAAPAKSDGPTGVYARASKGFMQVSWDNGAAAFNPDTWKEVLRVLKPGAHLLAFGGDRTQHRLVCAIEDAGFEIRGTLVYLFGSGFPKNLNVSRRLRSLLPADILCACALDCSQKAQGSQSDCQSYRGSDDGQLRAYGDSGLDVSPSQGDVPAHIHDGLPQDGQASIQANSDFGGGSVHPASEDLLRQSAPLLEGCPENGSIRFDNGTSTSCDGQTEPHRTAHYKSNTERSDGGLVSSLKDVNLPRCPNCGRFIISEGFGTALKPSAEFICLARKPLSEPTIAANVLRWGTGVINVDGCRVEADWANDPSKRGFGYGWAKGEIYDRNVPNAPQGREFIPDKGRWPANVIHDGSEEVVAGFPETQPLGGPKRTATQGTIAGSPNAQAGSNAAYVGDSGPAARFFYTAKADSDDRLGSSHPTVKPLDLMQYLVRLITPPKGLCLDLFAGTGTTGEAAFREGMRAVLIERETEYQADIRRRMALVLSGSGERAREAVKARMKDKPRDDGPLFGGTDLSGRNPIGTLPPNRSIGPTGLRDDAPQHPDWNAMWSRPFDYPERI